MSNEQKELPERASSPGYIKTIAIVLLLLLLALFGYDRIGSELYENIVQLKLAASDGEKYNTDCFNTNTQKLEFPDYFFILTFTCPCMLLNMRSFFLEQKSCVKG